jgi:serine/threonine protein kinase
VLYEEDEACLECDAARPQRGWAKIGNSTDPWLGRTLIERYLLTRRIGHGASGNVYRAESLTIGRQFAAKIIPFDSQSGSVNPKHVEARLHREIEALGALRNPHIVSFYDVVPLGGRAVALLMDLIEGQTLELMVNSEGPVDVLRTCKILRQIANGVHEAHEAGMIHRDLKPENIMVERLPAGDDFVHILDFGIVWREGDVRVTQGFLGTPLYASPEQAVGGELDRRADIYALGGVVFFMLTGQPPFFDNNVYKVLKAHVSTKPPKLADIAPDRYFPPEIESLVASMLAKSPTDRPQALSEVITTLDKLTKKLSEDSKTSGGAAKVSDSLDSPPAKTPGSTDEGADPHRTVQSEASLVEASKPHASRGSGVAAEVAQDGEIDKSGFFRSDEWDSTGPKAAILRRNTPTPGEQLPAVERRRARVSEESVSSVSESSFSESNFSEEVATPNTPSKMSFSDDEIRRNSGLYEIPRLAGSNTDSQPSGDQHSGDQHSGDQHSGDQHSGGGYRCAAARSQHLIVVDSAHQVLVRQGDEEFETKFKLPAEPELTSLCLQGESIFTGHVDGAVFLWSVADASSTRLHQNASTSAVRAIDCDASGRWLLFGTDVGGLYLAERRKKSQLQPLRIQSGPAVRAVALSAPRDTFAVARADRSIGVFSISSPTSLLHQFSADDHVERMAFSKDGYLLAVVFADKKLALYHVMTGKLVMRNDSMLEQPLSISFDDNNQLVGYCEVRGRIFGWDLHHNLVPHQPE